MGGETGAIAQTAKSRRTTFDGKVAAFCAPPPLLQLGSGKVEKRAGLARFYVRLQKSGQLLNWTD
jgi:hypothetical protein